MSRPKLSPLSSLLPPKGKATRPEPNALKSKQESEQARERSEEQEDMHTREQAGERAYRHVRGRESERASVPAVGAAENAYKEGPRSAVSFRMTENLQERLREYAFRARRKKQDILDDAVHEFLKREGY